MIGVATSGMTYSNEQQLKLTLIKQTLRPIMRNLEETLNRYLLTQKEQEQGYFFEFQYNDLLKSSPGEEMRIYGQAIKDKLITVNEARRKINFPYIEGGDNLSLDNEPVDNTLKGGDNDENGSTQ